MKRLFALLVLAISSFSVSAQTADDIVNNYVNAMGGAEKLSQIQSVKMSGTLTVMGFDVGIEISGSHGVGYRTDISVPGMGDGYQVVTPTKGWSYLPFQGQTSVEDMPEEQFKSGVAQVDLQGVLFNYKEKGNKVTLKGKEKVDGVDAYVLQVETSTGKTTTFYLDANTYYRIKSVSGEMEVYYSNYKKTAEGYVYPFTMRTPNGDITFTSIEVNKQLDPAIFKR